MKNLYREDAVEYIAANGVERTKALRMSDDSLATTYDVIKRQMRRSK